MTARFDFMVGRESRLPGGLAVGIAIACAVLIPAGLAGFIAPFEPTQMAAGPRLAPPSLQFPFGTDEFGRDLFSRVLFGARLSLGIGLGAVVSGLGIGAVVGLAAAFGGRFVEALLLRVVDVLYALPDVLIALALVAFLGPGIANVTAAVAASLAPVFARVTYGLAAAERAKPYVEAARLAGIGRIRLARIQVLPNIGQSLAVVATLGFSWAILSAAALSFLGLGVQPPSPEWGAILAAGRDYMTRAPWIMIFPGLAICLSALAINLIGDGLRETVRARQGSAA